MRFKKVIQDWFTEDDNVTWDWDVVMWTLGLLVFFGEVIYHSSTFNPIEFMTSFSAAFALKKMVQIYQKKGPRNVDNSSGT